jgi:putative aldouronate transport system substrate-binding protein
MKKYVVLLLVCACMVTLIIGCSNTSTNTEANDKQVESPAKVESNLETPKQDEGIAPDDFSQNVTFSYSVLTDLPPKKDAPVLKLLEEKYNINIDYVNINREQYNEMLGLKISTGDTPNFFMLDGNMTQYKTFQEQGILRSIPIEFMKKYAPTLYKDQEKYFKYLKMDGEVYGITGEKLDNSYPLNAIWRKDWLDQVGITKVPETLAEAEIAFYAFVNNDPDQNGKKDTYALGKTGLDMIFGAYGGIPWGPWPQYWLWLEDNGGLQNAAVKPEMKDALALLQKWYKDGIIDPEYVLGENKGGYWAIPTDFFNNKIGFTGLGHYYHWTPNTLWEGYTGGQVFAEFHKLQPDAEVAYGKPVVGPKGHSGTWQYPVGVGASGLYVFGSDATDEQVIRILQVIEDQRVDYDSYQLASSGVEGTHWERDNASQMISLKEGYRQREHLAEGASIFVFQSLEFQAKDKTKLTEFANQYYDFPGYVNELVVALPSESNFRADLEKLRDQYYTEIISGKKSVDAFDEFVEKWNKQGGDQLKKEADEWYRAQGK